MEKKARHEVFYDELQSLIKDFINKKKEYNRMGNNNYIKPNNKPSIVFQLLLTFL